MKIAQIAPLTEAVPPTLYGGTERVVSWLTEELVALGHEVTLFASGDSVTSAKLEAMWPRALRLDGTVRDPNALHMAMVEQVYRRAGEFDIMHFHMDYYPFSLMSRQSTPFVTTLHGRLDLPEHQPLFQTFSDIPVVSISDSQRRPVPMANWVETVHHGLPAGLLEPKQTEQSYLAFLGRISPEKRLDRAIRIAQRCGMKLKVAAKIDRADEDYFEEQIRPLIGGEGVEFIGEIGDHQKSDFLSGAHALLVPIDWPEPFGLVMIEAMACGTPVIAYNRGSVPEVVENGVTGFVVEDEISAAGAVRDLPQLSRENIRRRFEERFSARRMAEQYLGLYRRLADSGRMRPHLVAAR
ncbi:glycosyl transferase [Azorhizobium oxalatiphilum]|uniref:Glycosyl transferase n=1 Tax=Azorhizobium oxalatiphilum TaxID=980631 RepID=A0A917BS22_9HYPH|nr:glycosyltransferase family 4 protein [Azorhizobium oxalatiphilum]GGF54755.1 glycosyl transferase [Azorhizobium oxalatiphilum]